MERALYLLALLGVLGTFDTLWYHEYKGQLPAHVPGVHPELRLHAARDFIYLIVFGTLPWVAWQGWWTAALCVLLAAEVVVTITDFIVEDRVRKQLGGLMPGERATHALMGIVYGAMLAHIIPVLARWATAPSTLAFEPAPVPTVLRWALTAGAIGIGISGARDLYAASGGPHGAWPWQRARAT